MFKDERKCRDCGRSVPVRVWWGHQLLLHGVPARPDTYEYVDRDGEKVTALSPVPTRVPHAPLPGPPKTDHNDPRHIYDPVFNPSGCEKFYCLDRHSYVWRELLVARDVVEAASDVADSPVEFSDACINYDVRQVDKEDMARLRMALLKHTNRVGLEVER